ncbi:hypothetical protein WJ61_13530 [Burkholderia ubonensis]|nr:hypothetical protein WJ61_13530 [Burkholderia ubonensis]
MNAGQPTMPPTRTTQSTCKSPASSWTKSRSACDKRWTPWLRNTAKRKVTFAELIEVAIDVTRGRYVRTTQ